MLDGTDLRETLQAVLPSEMIKERARALGVIERERKLEVVTLVSSLVLSAGSDDSGRLADAFRRYQTEVSNPVVRGAFYEWVDDDLAELMEHLLESAMQYASTLPVHLPGVLSGVDDWIIVDSETITLRDALRDVYPASGSAAGVKVHKDLSVGRGCMSDYHLSPAREHDSPHLCIDKRYRGKGLLVDLGYASLKLIRDCEKHDVKFVIRLKKNWKPKVLSVSSAELSTELMSGADLNIALVDEVILMQGHDIDADVIIGRGSSAVHARVVAIALPKNDDGEIRYRFYLTNLPRETHEPQDVGTLYRVRWEIEHNNKVDKSGARLDQIRATSKSSVRVLVYAALLHTLICNILVHRDFLSEVEHGEETEPARTQPPLHPLLVAHAVRNEHITLLIALLAPATSNELWSRLARTIATQGRDPNWRARPSVLDQIRGLTAPRGRPRRRKLRDSPPGAAPYRRQSEVAKTHVATGEAAECGPN